MQERHGWLAQNEATMPTGLDWLSPRERARLGRFRFPKRRTEYLLRRWAGKSAVAGSIGWTTDSATVSRVELLNHVTGAPYVELDGRPADLDVSLSDRAGTAVALVGAAGSDSGSLGVDLEIVEPRSDAFVDDFFTEAERAWVHARRVRDGEGGWQEVANLIWSAKEAALKVLRVGLRADTRTVDVALDENRGADGWASMTVTSNAAGVMHGWWRRDGVFLLTVAYPTGVARPDPPVVLPGGVDLGTAKPVHSWMGRSPLT